LQQRKVDEGADANANPAIIESKNDSGSKKAETGTHGSDKAVAKKTETELESDDPKNSVGKEKAAGDSLSKTKTNEHEGPSEDGDKTVAVDHGLEVDTEWTKQGVEEVLATTGVQCAYNTEVGRVEFRTPYPANRSLTQSLCSPFSLFVTPILADHAPWVCLAL
jgi:cytoskeletal protein RodZ